MFLFKNYAMHPESASTEDLRLHPRPAAAAAACTEQGQPAALVLLVGLLGEGGHSTRAALVGSPTRGTLMFGAPALQLCHNISIFKSQVNGGLPSPGYAASTGRAAASQCTIPKHLHVVYAAARATNHVL